MTTREFRTGLPASILDGIQSGVRATRYRGIPFYKSPFDVVLYMQLIGRQQPKTIIEIGTKHGGSALWFADMLSNHAIEGRVISVDCNPTVDLDDSRISFLRGDAQSLGEVLTEELLNSLPRPWLVSEDSAHTYDVCRAVLQFFDDWLQPGDYMVIEDGVVASLADDYFRVYQDGPNRAVAAYLADSPGRCEIDTTLCDHFGWNVTYNPNGWLRCVA